MLSKIARTSLKPTRHSIKLFVTVILSVLFVLILLLNSFFMIDPSEVAVIYSLGNPVKTVEGGIHFKVPFYQSYKVSQNPKSIVKMYIGYRDNGKQQYELVPDEATMITADENLLNIEWMVELGVTDANRAMFETQDPQELIKNICLNEMRLLINSMTLDNASTVGRESIVPTLTPVIDKRLKDADIGFGLKRISIQDIQPPDTLAAAYQLVHNATQDSKTTIDNAKQEATKIVNEKLGDVAGRKAIADAKSNEILNAAKGEVSEYLAQYELYKKNSSITKTQIVMNMLEKILPKSKIYVLDGAGNTVKYINLDELKPQTQPAGK